ncbi:LTA synthase family protein [uncultured Hymenobacter sp.]|uniref:LTA synthase family protein n=1 Tax=uncultured Hymenobacter sp. TaxID=170016 RepID=UPI0035CB20FB
MIKRFAFQPRYFLFWLVFFVVSRVIFLLYHHALAAALPPATLLGIFGYGLRLDLSITAYLCLVPFGLFVIGSLAGPRFPLARLVGAYTAVVGAVLTILVMADADLYRVWGFRLDATALQYIGTPGEMAATATSAPLGLLFSLIGLIMLGTWGLYKLVVGRLDSLPPWFGRGRAALAGLLYVVLLALPLRGGTQQIPVNQSDVYFSDRPFANHAAINSIWNVADALLKLQSERTPRPYLADSTARRLVATLYPAGGGRESGAIKSASLLREPRPNVLFLILESFTAKLVGSVGGEAGVTPTLDSLARTGVLFNHIYAAGDRSQKGLVALLSGYPNQPTTSIIKYPRKTARLPHLARSLALASYHSRYYYGGELAFANMKSYLRTAGYEQLIERSDFRAQDQNSKWGAHDHVLFNRLLTDLPQLPNPFFVTAFTLSSHEPYDVPMKAKFPGKSEADLFRNSVYYTDSALGDFVRAARRQPWWEHTLVVLVADHGHPLPGNTPNDDPAKFHVPLVLSGGALRPEVRGRVVPEIGSQTDVAATLLRQLGLPATDYPWSRDLLRPAPVPFAFYCYTDGFGTVTPAGALTFDNVGRRVTRRSPGATEAQLELGKAYQQLSLEDFASK